MQVRQASVLDVDAIAPLLDAYRQFYGQPADLPRARSFLHERIALQESVVLAAFDAHGEAMGFVQLYPMFSTVRCVRTYVLNDLFVSPAARRHGCGERLLDAAAAHARAVGAASLSLETALDNAAAQALYASRGWLRDSQFCQYSLRV